METLGSLVLGMLDSLLLAMIDALILEMLDSLVLEMLGFLKVRPCSLASFASTLFNRGLDKKIFSDHRSYFH